MRGRSVMGMWSERSSGTFAGSGCQSSWGFICRTAWGAACRVSLPCRHSRTAPGKVSLGDLELRHGADALAQEVRADDRRGDRGTHGVPGHPNLGRLREGLAVGILVDLVVNREA